MRLDAFADDGHRVLVEARRAALAAHHARIGCEHLLLGCLADARVRDLLVRHGADLDAVGAGLPRPAPDRELLAALGIEIDPDEVRARVRASLGGAAPPLHLQRRLGRPLQIVFDGEGRRLCFTGHARKVVEAAIWRAGGARRLGRRQLRPANATDILFGILCDGRERTCRLLVAGGLRVERLSAEIAAPAARGVAGEPEDGARGSSGR